jgi:hypothetical protein
MTSARKLDARRITNIGSRAAGARLYCEVDEVSVLVVGGAEMVRRAGTPSRAQIA